MENKLNFAFSKENFIIVAVAVAIIILGFCLMIGGASTEEHGFNPEMFSFRRIVLAPIVTVIGFVLVAVGILRKDKNLEKQNKA